MGIDSQTQDHYFQGILQAINGSPQPLKIPDLLQRVQSNDTSIKREIVVALLWHMLATHRLRFDESRNLQISS